MPTWEDAHDWAYDVDHDGTGDYEPPIGIIVLADVDGELWNTYAGCGFTPHMFIIDQGGMMIDDACEGDLISCFSAPCGSQEERSKDILRDILAPEWCGTADP